MDIAIDSATDLLSLSKINKELDKHEKLILDEINGFFLKRSDLENKLTSIKSSIPDFETLESSAKKSSKLVSIASNLALELSNKVRQLDLVKNHVLSCVKKLDDIITLKVCAAGAKDSLTDKNYEKAAAYVYQYLCIDKNIISLADQMMSDELNSNALTILSDCHGKLVKIVAEKFDQAVLKNDKVEVDRFFKLFKLVGISAEGLERFGHYLASIITKKCDSLVNLYEMSNTETRNSKWIGLFTEILEFIAATLKDNQVSVETYYGPGNLFILIEPIQNVCDHFVEHVIGRFYSQHNLTDLYQMIKNPSNVSGKSESNANTNMDDSRFKRVLAIESVITDMVALNSCSDLYLRFLRRRIMTDLKELNLLVNEHSKKVNEISRFFDNCKLVCTMQDLISGYTSLDCYYLREMIIKAISMDEVDDNSKTWRYSDDIFFVLKKCFIRSFSTGSVDGICAVLNNGSTFLSDYLINATLGKYIRHGFPSGWMQDAYNYMQSSVAAASSIGTPANSISFGGSNSIQALGQLSSGSLTRYNFLITINSIELSKKNLDNLITSLFNEVISVYEQKDTNFKKLQVSFGNFGVINLIDMMCLSECKNSNMKQLQHFYDMAFEQLTSSVICGQAKSVLNPFASMKYNLVEDDLDLFAVNDPWIEVCITSIDNFLQPFLAILSSESNDHFLLILTTELQRRLEQLIQRKTYNRFGAVQLEKECRCLFGYLTSISYVSLRDQFTRIFQICKLLNLDTVEEVYYFWNSSTWRLTPNEVRRFLSFRIDFATDEIRRLRL